MSLARLSAAKRRHADEEIHPLLGERLELTEPRCPYFETCGGCQVQHLPYALQLAYKREAVRRSFLQEGLEIDACLDETAGMSDPWHYRNKADFNVRVFGGSAHLGFSPFEGKGLVEVAECPISSPEINAVLAAFREVLPRWPGLRRKIHSVIVRSSRHERKAAVLYHTKLKDPATFQSLSEQVSALCPELKGAGFVAKRRMVGTGELTLTERVLGIDYTYALTSFFQANPEQAETLVQTVLDQAAVGPGDEVGDLYSGVGLFTMPLARRARLVHAIEDSPSAAGDAERNASRLGLENCKFLRGQVQEKLENLNRFGVSLDVIVADPPRSGCAEEALGLMTRFAPRRIIYVSCNPGTLARDARWLVDAGYDVGNVRPVDMFPQTQHIECVARFDRR